MEGLAGPYGPDRTRRLVIATADPATLPEATTWYLATTLPLVEVPVAEVVRLYGLRTWVEQQYKQIKGSLGWSQYQVRSDRAMRRHWALVQCAFAFCWWAETRSPLAAEPEPTGTTATSTQDCGGERGGKGAADPGRPLATSRALLAAGAAAGAGLAGTGLVPVALLARLVESPATRTPPSPARLARSRLSPRPL